MTVAEDTETQTDARNLFGAAAHGPGDASTGTLLRAAFCSHCSASCDHDLIEAGDQIAVAAYQCRGCAGRTYRCANFERCGGAAKMAHPRDEVLSTRCACCATGPSSPEGVLEEPGGGPHARKEPGAKGVEEGERTSSPKPDGWSVLAHILLPPGLDGGVSLRKTPKPRHESSALAEEPSRSPRLLRGMSQPDLQSQLPASDREGDAEAAVTEASRVQRRMEPVRVEADAAVSPARCPSSSSGSETSLAQTVQALKAAMHVANPVAQVPAAVADRASTTQLEPWQFMREALLSWPGPERDNVDKYRAMVCHQVWLQRWLTACGGDVVWAMKRILTHLEWRQEYRVDSIMDEDWSDYDRRHEMYPSGICKAGRPTWTWNVAKHSMESNGVPPNATPELGARYLVLTLERVWAMNPSAPQLNTICNCEGMGFSNYEHKMCLLCLDILSEQYPDNMHVCFMFPVTWVVSASVAVCRPLVSEYTFQKHKLLQANEWETRLQEAFDAEELEPMFGGTLDVHKALTRSVMLRAPGLLAAWEQEEELALACFTPSAPARQLQREILAFRGHDPALADSSQGRPGSPGLGEPFCHCLRFWRFDRSLTLSIGAKAADVAAGGPEAEASGQMKAKARNEDAVELDDSFSGVAFGIDGHSVQQVADDHEVSGDEAQACVGKDLAVAGSMQESVLSASLTAEGPIKCHNRSQQNRSKLTASLCSALPRLLSNDGHAALREEVEDGVKESCVLARDSVLVTQHREAHLDSGSATHSRTEMQIATQGELAWGGDYRAGLALLRSVVCAAVKSFAAKLWHRLHRWRGGGDSHGSRSSEHAADGTTATAESRGASAAHRPRTSRSLRVSG